LDHPPAYLVRFALVGAVGLARSFGCILVVLAAALGRRDPTSAAPVAEVSEKVVRVEELAMAQLADSRLSLLIHVNIPT
jgi:hypothetical protein